MEFADYLLRVEYRFVGDQIDGGPGWAFRNSGLMLHGQPAASMGRDQKFPASIPTAPDADPVHTNHGHEEAIDAPMQADEVDTPESSITVPAPAQHGMATAPARDLIQACSRLH